MAETSTAVLAWVEHQGVWAPLLFIGIHLLRPLLFLPVMLVCITGGLLFGPVAGTAYSVIGTLLSSLIFYRMIRFVPFGLKKMQAIYQKWNKRRSQLTVRQVAILRLIPFIHFHLLSYCLIEMSTDFKDYTKSSLLANFPLAVVYTSVGQWITLLSIPMLLVLSGVLAWACYMVRKKYEVMIWQDFFQPS
ncbi:TVP38/TMEM64 family protein [Halobacillus amylolyticus]|uniref:TVP38/TMEM64 family membrane protein n=1 Tax=Halobacillus amylolyticus TaxID=2932259 RepID=A0ABY4HBC2_9BACI|nr:VTT domain-containing protein [Halobacillus amylolyticus]UOR11972.1 VTT domain-containing protein [Halobacillus amylolyticus]